MISAHQAHTKLLKKRLKNNWKTIGNKVIEKSIEEHWKMAEKLLKIKLFNIDRAYNTKIIFCSVTDGMKKNKKEERSN